MKMDGVSDLVNGRNEAPPKLSQPSPKEIGREFVRQYYTMLSERPQDVFRFYSHESFFVHDTENPVQGQQKIQKAIERLAFVDCKARIYTVSGTATLNNGLVIQTPKKYYVHNDVFQWLDRAFGDVSPQQGSTPEGATTEGEAAAAANGEQAAVNGHQQISAPLPSVIPATVSGSVEVEEEEEKEESEPEIVQNPLGDEVVPPEPEVKREIISEKPAETFTEERPVTEQVVEQSAVVADNKPTTWAKLVGGNAALTPPQTQQAVPQPARVHAPTVVNPRLTTPATQPSTVSVPPPPAAAMPPLPPTLGNDNGFLEHEQIYGAPTNSYHYRYIGDDGCKLYVGGIVRSNYPESPAIPEKEIREAFEKFGAVASVNVPRRVFEGTVDGTLKHIYAFVVMKTPEGAENAFRACRKERNIHYLQLKLDSFGFDGEATLSEQRGSGGNVQRGSSYSHRGGMPMQGVPRGGFNMRGNPGGRSGAPRGVHARHYGMSGGNEFRHSGGTHPQHG